MTCEYLAIVGERRICLHVLDHRKVPGKAAHEVTEQDCQRCPIRSKPCTPRIAPTAEQVEASVRPREKLLPCVHLGTTVEEVRCEPCGGNVRLKVFSCAIHGKCSLGDLPGVKRCGKGRCADYRSE